MMKSLFRVLAILAIVGGQLLLAVPAYAIEQPDSDPEITHYYANINLAESGDVLIYGEYLIPYETIPDISADWTYTFRLIDTDNMTQLGAVLPFVRLDGGYNKGVFSFYFPASENLTTDRAYIIRISQNPAYFDDPESFDYPMPLSSWTNQTTQEDNRTELALNVIAMAQRMDTFYSDDGLELLESSAGGTVLSSPVGENYFRGAIYGIQMFAPEIFLVQVYTFETGDRAWTTAEFDTYEDRFTGTFIGTSSENTSATFGISTTTLMSILFGLPIILGAVVISAIKFRRVEPSYLVASLVLIMLVLMGWMPKAIFALIYQAMAIYIAYLWFFARKTASFDLSFLAFVWFISTLICVVMEGGDFGFTATSTGGAAISGPGTIINDLAAIQQLSISNLVGIPSALMTLGRGLFRMLIWDYSFYSGGYVMVRWFLMATLSSAAVWGIFVAMAHIFANFLPQRIT